MQDIARTRGSDGWVEPGRVSIYEPGGDYGGETQGALGLDLHRIWIALRRNILWIGAIVGATVVLGLVVTLLMVPQYVGTSRVLVEQEAEKIIEDQSSSAAGSSYWDADRFLQTQMGIISSRSLALRVVEAGGLAEKAEFYAALGEEMPDAGDVTDKRDPAQALATLRRDTAADLVQENLDVKLPDESRLISVSFRSADPALSAQVANLVAENFIENNLARQVDSSAYARQFLQKELEEARDKLEASERDLNQYSRAAGLIRIAGQGQNADQETTLSVTNDSLIQVNAAASQATAERIAAQDRWRTISGQPVLSLAQVLQNSAVQSLLEQRGKAEADLAQERSRHLEAHPSVKALEAQIAGINRQIDAIGNSIKNSVKLDYEAAREKEQTLLGRVNEIRAAAMNEQDRGVQYSVLKRVKDTNRALYDTLLVRYNELNATSGSAFNNVSLVDRAETPKFPASPNLLLNLLLSLLLGAGLAVVFVVLRELMDDSLRSPDDVEAKLGFPLLGLIPKTEDADMEEAFADPKSGINEAYNSLVANIRLSSPAGVPSTLIVTSSQAAEGKSTSSRAIAENLARFGKRVILVDADLRRPTLHARMSSRKKAGLSAVITGALSVEDAIEATAVENLYYMSGLPQPPEPSLLLGSARFDEVIADLKTRFDVVMIDCPPILGLSDTPTIAHKADGVIFVVDAGHNHRGGIKSALRRLSMVNARVLGIVLTKFDPKDSSSSYAYYGYHYYNYGDRKG